MVQGSSSWPLWVDATDLCCLRELMMMMMMKCTLSFCVRRGIPVNGNVVVALDYDGCRGTYQEVQYAEHVQAVVTLSAPVRGEVEIFLTSPAGTRSTLLPRRVRDTSGEGFTNWAFMTTHCWGESVVGTWRLEVRNGATTCKQYIHYLHQQQPQF